MPDITFQKKKKKMIKPFFDHIRIINRFQRTFIRREQFMPKFKIGTKNKNS